MLHWHMITPGSLLPFQLTAPRNAFFRGALPLIMRCNPRRMTSLQNFALQVPWNHILVQNTRGWGCLRLAVGAGPRCLHCLSPSVRIAAGFFPERKSLQETWRLKNGD